MPKRFTAAPKPQPRCCGRWLGVALAAQLYVIAPQAKAAAATAAATDTDGSLAVAEAAMCAAALPAAAAASDATVDARSDAMPRLQQAIVQWVDAWDAAGRPPASRRRTDACPLPAPAEHYRDALCDAAGAAWASAASKFAAAAQMAPHGWCADIRQRQALCALHQGEPEAALAHLQASQQGAPMRVSIRLLTAQTYLAAQRYAAAAAALRPLLCCTAVPTAREIEQARRLNDGIIAAAGGRLSRPETTAIQNLMALAQQPEADDAVAEIALSLAASLPKTNVQTAAALVVLKAGHAEAGRALLKQALAQAPLDPDPPRLLALYNVEHGGPTAALPCLAMAAHRDPFNAETQRLVLELAERRQDWPVATAAVQALLRLEPDHDAHRVAWRRLQAAQANTLP